MRQGVVRLDPETANGPWPRETHGRSSPSDGNVTRQEYGGGARPPTYAEFRAQSLAGKEAPLPEAGRALGGGRRREDSDRGRMCTAAC